MNIYIDHVPVEHRVKLWWFDAIHGNNITGICEWTTTFINDRMPDKNDMTVEWFQPEQTDEICEIHIPNSNGWNWYGINKDDTVADLMKLQNKMASEHPEYVDFVCIM